MWRNGLLISILSISTGFVFLPISAAFLNKILILKTQLSDRTDMLNPVPVEVTTTSTITDSKTMNKLILNRIRNKIVCNILMIFAILIQVLDYNGLINTSKQDIWYQFHSNILTIYGKS